MARQKASNGKTTPKKCGIIMPISPQRYGSVEYPPEYWNSMLLFLRDAIKKAGYDPVPMWEDDTTSSITPRIVKNINDFPLAVCVISAFNPNVMMELGMRLCCNKPVLVIFDEHIVSLPFDIKDLESYQIPSRPIYSQYPEICKKIGEFLHKMDSSDYKTFLDNFTVTASVDLQNAGEYSGDKSEEIQQITKEISSLSLRIGRLENDVGRGGNGNAYGPTGPSPCLNNVFPGEMPDWLQIQT